MKTYKFNGTNLTVTDGNTSSTYSAEIGDIIVPLVSGVNRALPIDRQYDPLTAKLLEDLYSYGVEWDTGTSSTNSAVTRIGNAQLHRAQPIVNSFRGCIAQGGRIIYYLDASDWTKKEDGTASRLDGYDGEVKVATPRFYGKSGTTNGKNWVRISEYYIDETWTEIPALLISAYAPAVLRNVPSDMGWLSTLTTGALVSISNANTYCRGGNNRTDFDAGVTSSNWNKNSVDAWKSLLGKPATSMTIAAYESAAAKSNNELITYDIYKWIFCWCYVIEYANFDMSLSYNSAKDSNGYCQGGLGATWAGNWNSWTTFNGNNPIQPCGFMNDFGNHSGVRLSPSVPVGGSNANITSYAKKWHGFELTHGHIWLLIDGIMFKRDTANTSQRAYIFKSGHHLNNTSLANATNCRIVEGLAMEGWILNFKVGDKGDILTVASGTNRVKDYYWCNNSSTGWRLLLVGGAVVDGSNSGLFAFASSNGVGNSDSHFGALSVARLVSSDVVSGFLSN